MKYLISLVFSSLLASGPVLATERGMAIKRSHTANIIEIGYEVNEATGGQLNITVHSADSLSKHSEMQNAVRGQQVVIDKIFLSQITPPVGFNLFVIQGLTGMDLLRVDKAALAIFLSLIQGVVTVVMSPSIVTFLPELMTNN